MWFPLGTYSGTALWFVLHLGNKLLGAGLSLRGDPCLPPSLLRMPGTEQMLCGHLVKSCVRTEVAARPEAGCIQALFLDHILVPRAPSSPVQRDNTWSRWVQKQDHTESTEGQGWEEEPTESDVWACW